MLTDQDVTKLINAMKEVFPTAEMVKTGFDGTATKHDLAAFRQYTEGRFSHIDARLDTIERDIRDLVHREEFTDLMARVKYIEERLGIESGT